MVITVCAVNRTLQCFLSARGQVDEFEPCPKIFSRIIFEQLSHRGIEELRDKDSSSREAQFHNVTRIKRRVVRCVQPVAVLVVMQISPTSCCTSIFIRLRLTQNGGSKVNSEVRQ